MEVRGRYYISGTQNSIFMPARNWMSLRLVTPAAKYLKLECHVKIPFPHLSIDSHWVWILLTLSRWIKRKHTWGLSELLLNKEKGIASRTLGENKLSGKYLPLKSTTGRTVYNRSRVRRKQWNEIAWRWNVKENVKNCKDLNKKSWIKIHIVNNKEQNCC